MQIWCFTKWNDYSVTIKWMWDKTLLFAKSRPTQCEGSSHNLEVSLCAPTDALHKSDQSQNVWLCSRVTVI